MANIKDVARLAGVSTSTVSRVINNTANVDLKKKNRVYLAIKKTGYKPNELARALYKKSSKIIGVIVPNIQNPFFNELAKAIEDEIYSNGYRMLLCNSDNNSEKELINIQMLTQMNSDGIILMTNSNKTCKEIHNCQIPIVAVDRIVKGGCCLAYVESDHYKGATLATKHLIDCGCKNIVCMRGSMSFSSGLLRYQGYSDVCKKYNLDEHVIDCGYDYKSGINCAKKILKKHPYVDGIITTNDIVAISVYKVLSTEGIKVPDQVQIVGFDNIIFSEMVTPAITTIGQKISDLGKTSVQILIKNKENLPFKKENKFDVSLIKRQTTKNI